MGFGSLGAFEECCRRAGQHVPLSASEHSKQKCLRIVLAGQTKEVCSLHWVGPGWPLGCEPRRASICPSCYPGWA